MKKNILFLIIILFPLSVNALDIQTQLSTIENDILELDERMDDYQNTRLDKTYPIGSIFETTNYLDVSQVQNVLGGTWEIYGAGRILVGINTSDANFNLVNKTGGVSSITLSTANLPSHNHSISQLSISTSASGEHSHNVSANNDQSGYGVTIPEGSHYFKVGSFVYSGTTEVSNRNRLSGSVALTAGAHKHSATTTASNTENAGSGTSFTNFQPSIAVYRYIRIS